MALTYEVLQAYIPEGSTAIGILNNRWGRGRRAEPFARMVQLDLAPGLDAVITFGDGHAVAEANLRGAPRPSR